MDVRELEALNRKIADRRDERARSLGALEQSKERAKAEFGVDILISEVPDPDRPNSTKLVVDASAAEALLADLEARVQNLDTRIEQEGVKLQADVLAAGF